MEFLDFGEILQGAERATYSTFNVHTSKSMRSNVL